MNGKIMKWMKANYERFYDDSGEFQCTQIAEACAEALGHSEWLDDDLHIIWDHAVVVSEWAERQAVR